MTIGESILIVALLLNAAITGFGVWLAWAAAKSANVAVEKIEEVRHETNSMRTALEAAKKAEGRLEAQQEAAAIAKNKR